MCKTLDLDSVGSSFKTADWKFQSNYVKWCKINCNFDISQPSSGGNMFSPVKVQLKVCFFFQVVNHIINIQTVNISINFYFCRTL